MSKKLEQNNFAWAKLRLLTMPAEIGTFIRCIQRSHDVEDPKIRAVIEEADLIKIRIKSLIESVRELK